MHEIDAIKVQANHHNFIFSDVVMEAPFLDNFKMSNITSYDGKGDPVTHVEVFQS